MIERKRYVSIDVLTFAANEDTKNIYIINTPSKNCKKKKNIDYIRSIFPSKHLFLQFIVTILVIHVNINSRVWKGRIS